MRKVFVAFLFPLTCFASLNYSGDGPGNGGDVVRSHLLERGHLMVEFLRDSTWGNQFSKEWKINPIFIGQVLDTTKIKVVNGPLYDNKGDLVDATGERDLITLDRMQWKDYILQGYDLDKIIFHEMLRASGYNDDEYVISRPFNKLFKIAMAEDSVAEDRAYKFLLVEIEREILKAKTRLVIDPSTEAFVVDGDPLASNYSVCIRTLNTHLEHVADSSILRTCHKISTFAFMACVANTSHLRFVSGSEILSLCVAQHSTSKKFLVKITVTIDFMQIERQSDLDLSESETWILRANLSDGYMSFNLGEQTLLKGGLQRVTFSKEVRLEEADLADSLVSVNLIEGEVNFFDRLDQQILGKFTLRNQVFQNSMLSVVVDSIERIHEKKLLIRN